MHLHQDPEAANVIPRLSILTVKTVRRKTLVTEYVDVTTGEIFTAEKAQTMGVRSIRPDAKGRREKKLNQLRGEPRKFADFLLRFRDRRCKFLVTIDTLVGWYSKLTEKKAHHVRRYFAALIKAGILDPDLMLNEDFMINNPFAGKESAKGDTFRAYNVFDGILLQQQG